MLIRLLVVLVLCTFHDALKVNADGIAADVKDLQDFFQAVQENDRDDEDRRQLPPLGGQQGPTPPLGGQQGPTPPLDGQQGPTPPLGGQQGPTPPLAGPQAPPETSPPPGGAPSPSQTPPTGPGPQSPSANPGEASLEVPENTFNVSKVNDWTFTLALKIKPEAPNDVRFHEGDKEVKMGESSKSFDFKQGKLDNGLLLIPVQVKDHKEQQLKFKVAFKGKHHEITVNVEEEEKPAFELPKDNYVASEDGNWKFMVVLKADKMQDYNFTEGGESAKPGEKTKSLRFGDLAKMGNNREYHIPVEVIDLSQNSIKFTITADHTTKEAMVRIEPPKKPMLLKKEFDVDKDTNFTFELQIKSKTPPSSLKFTEGNSTVQPGNGTASFHFGQLTNDLPNLYSVEVKVTSTLDKPRHFEVSINGERTTVEVSKKESESSAVTSAPLTLTCLILPILLMFLR